MDHLADHDLRCFSKGEHNLVKIQIMCSMHLLGEIMIFVIGSNKSFKNLCYQSFGFLLKMQIKIVLFDWGRGRFLFEVSEKNLFLFNVLNFNEWHALHLCNAVFY